jgi:ArsR family transcriptional regulator, arsenate/arsenite/antimonite-responsive transcriptional repressor
MKFTIDSKILLSYIYDIQNENIMAVSKKEEFTPEDVWLADVAKALSHPARIRILKILNDLNSCMVGSLVEQLPLAQATVSQHLKELKRVGLITGEIDGPKICYCINNKVLTEAKNALDKLFNKIGCC